MLSNNIVKSDVADSSFDSIYVKKVSAESTNPLASLKKPCTQTSETSATIAKDTLSQTLILPNLSKNNDAESAFDCVGQKKSFVTATTEFRLHTFHAQETIRLHIRLEHPLQF